MHAIKQSRYKQYALVVGGGSVGVHDFTPKLAPRTCTVWVSTDRDPPRSRQTFS